MHKMIRSNHTARVQVMVWGSLHTPYTCTEAPQIKYGALGDSGFIKNVYNRYTVQIIFQYRLQREFDINWLMIDLKIALY